MSISEATYVTLSSANYFIYLFRADSRIRTDVSYSESDYKSDGVNHCPISAK